jgi:hypothetical protein
MSGHLDHNLYQKENDWRKGNSEMRTEIRKIIRSWHNHTCNPDSDLFSNLDFKLVEDFYQRAADAIWAVADKNELSKEYEPKIGDLVETQNQLWNEAHGPGLVAKINDYHCEIVRADDGGMSIAQGKAISLSDREPSTFQETLIELMQTSLLSSLQTDYLKVYKDNK